MVVVLGRWTLGQMQLNSSHVSVKAVVWLSPSFQPSHGHQYCTSLGGCSLYAHEMALGTWTIRNLLAPQATVPVLSFVGYFLCSLHFISTKSWCFTFELELTICIPEKNTSLLPHWNPICLLNECVPAAHNWWLHGGCVSSRVTESWGGSWFL